MVHSSILQEVINANVAKKIYKQKYHQAKANVASTVAIHVITCDATVTSPTPAITTAIVGTTLKELETNLTVKPKVALPSNILVPLVRLLVKPVILLRTQEVEKEFSLGLLSFIQKLDESDSDSEFEEVTETVGPPAMTESDQDNEP